MEFFLCYVATNTLELLINISVTIQLGPSRPNTITTFLSGPSKPNAATYRFDTTLSLPLPPRRRERDPTLLPELPISDFAFVWWFLSLSFLDLHKQGFILLSFWSKPCITLYLPQSQRDQMVENHPAENQRCRELHLRNKKHIKISLLHPVEIEPKR